MFWISTEIAPIGRSYQYDKRNQTGAVFQYTPLLYISGVFSITFKDIIFYLKLHYITTTVFIFKHFKENEDRKTNSYTKFTFKRTVNSEPKFDHLETILKRFPIFKIAFRTHTLPST